MKIDLKVLEEEEGKGFILELKSLEVNEEEEEVFFVFLFIVFLKLLFRNLYIICILYIWRGLLNMWVCISLYDYVYGRGRGRGRGEEKGELKWWIVFRFYR